MNSYIFVLGTTSFELCQAELTSVLNSLTISYTERIIHEPLLSVESPQVLDAQELIGRLGGCSKIARVLGTISQPDASEIARYILRSIQSTFTFGLSFYSPSPTALSELHAQIKSRLITVADKIRYVMPQRGSVLSSVVISKQHVSEYIVFYDEGTKTWKIAKTLAIQDANEWTQREFGRPHADPKSGMLPQKVARMMVNLAVGTDQGKPLEKLALLDPFCGMGTILVEALLLGLQVIGSDQKSEVLSKTGRNLDWLTSIYRNIEKSNYRLLVSDATHISRQMQSQSVDAIVTEPFMGKVIEKRRGEFWQQGKRIGEAEGRQMIKGLEKLYIGSFRDWRSILKKDGRIVIAFPQLSIGSRFFSVKNPVDTCEKLGYTLTHGPYTYARPQAIVRRQIYVFRKI